MTYLYRVRWLLLALLIGLAPFHAFLITWAKSALPGELAVGLSVWREAAVISIGFIVVIEILVKKRLPKLDALDFAIIGYFALAVIWIFFQAKNPVQWGLGFRFDVLPFLFFMIVRQVEWGKEKALAKVAIGGAAIVIAFGLVHAIILPRDFLVNFGYSTYQGQYQPEIAVSACQFLEHTKSVCRAISTFGGPTRYGVYLMVVLGLLLPFLAYKSKYRIYAGALAGLAILSAILTYSRSVWIGVFAMAAFAAFIFLRNKSVAEKLKKHMRSFVIVACAALTVILVCGGFWIASELRDQNSFLRTVLVRTSSSSEHLMLAKEGLNKTIQHPFGMGLGTAGPASVRFDKFLTENWFLQISVETGVIGLLIFLAILFFMSKNLLAKRLADERSLAKIGLFLSLIGICVTGLFTHSFEETSAVLILMAFAGVMLNKEKRTEL